MTDCELKAGLQGTKGMMTVHAGMTTACETSGLPDDVCSAWTWPMQERISRVHKVKSNRDISEHRQIA